MKNPSPFGASNLPLVAGLPPPSEGGVGEAGTGVPRPAPPGKRRKPSGAKDFERLDKSFPYFILKIWRLVQGVVSGASRTALFCWEKVNYNQQKRENSCQGSLLLPELEVESENQE